MRDGCVMARVSRNPYVQSLDNTETKRFGYPLLETLKRTFKSLKKLESKAKHNTYFFPAFFACNDDLCITTGAGDDSYIRREASIFIATLFMLGLECVVNRRKERRSIAIICYLSCVIADLKAFLETGLESICRYWHRTLFPNSECPSYNMETLKETVSLAILGPFEAKGKTADIVFLVGMKRKQTDRLYAGLMAEIPLVAMHFTRARLRLYAFVHDLLLDTAKQEIELERKEGPTLRAKSPKQNINFVTKKMNNTNIVYEELKFEHLRTWFVHTTRDYRVGHLRRPHTIFEDLRRDLPFMRSTKYREIILRDLEDVDTTIGNRFKSYEYWEWTLRSACEWWQYMQNKQWWPEASPAEMKDATPETLNNIKWWRALLHADQQCASNMIKDNRRNERVTAMRTDKQLQEDPPTPNIVRPTNDAVFRRWRKMMLHCSTVTLLSNQDCTICLPFSTLQMKALFDADNEFELGTTLPHSAGWLARAIAVETERIFENSGVLCFWIHKFLPPSYMFSVSCDQKRFSRKPEQEVLQSATLVA